MVLDVDEDDQLELVENADSDDWDDSDTPPLKFTEEVDDDVTEAIVELLEFPDVWLWAVLDDDVLLVSEKAVLDDELAVVWLCAVLDEELERLRLEGVELDVLECVVELLVELLDVLPDELVLLALDGSSVWPQQINVHHCCHCQNVQICDPSGIYASG